MESIIGKAFTIPEDIQRALLQLEKEKDNAVISAKAFMEEKIEIEKHMQDIIKQNLEILQDHKFIIDTKEMKVTIIDKEGEL